MKKHVVTALALASAMCVIAHASAAKSAEKATGEKSAAAKAPAKNGLTEDLMKVSRDGYSALRHSCRTTGDLQRRHKSRH